MDFTKEIGEYIDLEILTLQKLSKTEINEFINALDETRLRGGTVYIMGNGGSAATASHYANDYNKGLSCLLEKKFNFVCLSDNISTLTAIANDNGYDKVFEYQLQGRATGRDLVVAISGSGNSPNILRAVMYAKSVGVKTVGLSGYDGGKLRTIADISVHVPVMSMQVAEDLHMVIDHLTMAVFYRALCGVEHLR